MNLIGSSEDDNVYSIGGFNDNGVAITQRAELPWWSVGEEFYVSFRFLYMRVVQWGQYSPQVDVFIDGVRTSITIDLAGGIDWSSGAWSTAADTYFITSDIPIRQENGVNYKGRFLKVKVEHIGLYQPLTWIDASLLFTRTKELYRGTNITVLGGMGV